jgi:hypothetical protein
MQMSWQHTASRAPAPSGPPREWREVTSQPFDPRANVGASVHTLPGLGGLDALASDEPARSSGTDSGPP